MHYLYVRLLVLGWIRVFFLFLFLWAAHLSNIGRQESIPISISAMMSYSSYECEWYLSNHWHHPNPKMLLLSTSWIIDLPLKSVSGRLSQSLEIAIKPLLLLQIKLSTKYLKEGQNCGFDRSSRELSIKSSLACCVTELIFKVGWDFL